MCQIMKAIHGAYEAGTGNAILMYDIVREYARVRRREKRYPPNPRRVTLPVASAVSNTSSPMAPPPPQRAINGLLVDRKRKALGSPSPMIRAKRHDNGAHKSSPWSNEPWVREHAKDIDRDIEEKIYRTARRRQSINKSTPRSIAHRRLAWNPPNYKRSPSPHLLRPPRLSILHREHRGWESIYQTSDEPDTPQSPPREEIMPVNENTTQLDIDEETLQAADFTPRKAPDTKSEPTTQTEVLDVVKEEQDPPAQHEDVESEEDEWAWDKEGDDDYRKLLRSLPESHDEEGYKVPIDGTISPETQLWNESHRQKLLSEAAHEQQTPSRPPKEKSISISSSSSIKSEVASDGDARDLRPLSTEKKEEEGSTQSTSEKLVAKSSSPTLTVAQEPNNVRNGIKDILRSPAGIAELQQTTPRVDSRQENEAPSTASALKGMKNLNLGSGPMRTPKAKVFEQEKSARRTRTQELMAQREAAKNAYPIVPLSDTWDQKVRHAVNNGHGRFEAKMFNKCVPEYSRDPTANSLWLDDAVINDYVVMVAKHGSKDDRKTQVRSVSALSSFFYTKISAPNPNFSSCAGMVRRAGIQGKNLLECQKVFIPINKTYHWTLAVIEPKVEEGLSPIEHKRKVTIYNSMGSSGGQQVAAHIMKWIQHELGASFKQEEWKIIPAGESPQQRNTDDCGVFTVTTARQIMLGKFVPDMYPADIINIQRKRIVAELVHGGLLSKEESEAG